MSWTAVIPFKGSERKTRLASIFSPAQRSRFSQQLLQLVCDALAACRDVEIILLSDIRASGWTGSFIQDEGRGLNAELAAVARGRPGRRLLIIHADLPLLCPSDVSALIDEADKAGCAIAPDRHGSGTNALALVDPEGFAFQFGPGSMARHVRASGETAGIVERVGLSFDIDTPEDYFEACRIAPDIMQRAAP